MPFHVKLPSLRIASAMLLALGGCENSDSDKVEPCVNAACLSAAAPKCDMATNSCIACASDSDCSSRTDALTKCDSQSHACVGSNIVSCNSEELNPGDKHGPGVCDYGEYCAGSPGVCTPVPVASCDGAAGYTWNEANLGPIITQIEPMASSASDCSFRFATTPGFKFRLTFYAPAGLAADDYYPEYVGIAHVVFRDPNGKALSAADDGFIQGEPAAEATSGTIVVGMCNVDPSATGWAVYLLDKHFKTGNIVCLK